MLDFEGSFEQFLDAVLGFVNELLIRIFDELAAVFASIQFT